MRKRRVSLSGSSAMDRIRQRTKELAAEGDEIVQEFEEAEAQLRSTAVTIWEGLQAEQRRMLVRLLDDGSICQDRHGSRQNAAILTSLVKPGLVLVEYEGRTRTWSLTDLGCLVAEGGQP